MLEYATITAPFTGIVTRKIASVGDLASPGVALLELENEKVLQVVAQVPEGLILKVRKGDVLPVSIPAAELSLNGEVAEVAPAADPSSRTASVKINITDGADIRPGQFARVTLTGSEEKFLTISDKAVLSFGQMERVFLIEDADQGGPSVASAKEGAGTASVARLRLVRTGTRYDGQVEILAGLAPGDRVVVSGGEKLQDGQPLDVQPQAKNGSMLRAPEKETVRP
ncbi:MAG: efflux RND transporter periplasmic adaptor subunit [Desulfocapsaceae bacterium]|nr:efflux RND transporter periplasmic adaptor subunit [Desulfocapsaceae bacterium]